MITNPSQLFPQRDEASFSSSLTSEWAFFSFCPEEHNRLDAVEVSRRLQILVLLLLLWKALPSREEAQDERSSGERPSHLRYFRHSHLDPKPSEHPVPAKPPAYCSPRVHLRSAELPGQPTKGGKWWGWWWWWDELGDWDWHIYTNMYKVDN